MLSTIARDVSKMKICALFVTVAMKASLIQCSGCHVPVNVQVNTRLAGYSIGRFDVGSLRSCARMCLSFSVCKSFDYKKSPPGYTCKLNSRNSSTVSGSPFSNVDGSVFSDISTWPVELVGSCSQRSCKSNEICLPTGSSYVCKIIECGEQPTITNGVIDSPSTECCAPLLVICLPGYRVGNNTSRIQCQASGEWRMPTPQCIPVDCGSPDIPHATYDVSSTTYEAIIDVTCEDGYLLNGTSSINCLDNGTWSAVPECLQIVSDCGDPAIANSTYNDTATVYGTFLEVMCDMGFLVNGSSVITCQSNGMWTAKPTCYQGNSSCEGLDCFTFYPDAYLSAYYGYPHLMVSSIQSVDACLQLCDEQFPLYLSINYSPNNKWCGCYGFTYQQYINDGKIAYAGYDLYEKNLLADF